MEELIELLKKQKNLQYDNTISDEIFYILDEKISNEIANYSIEEIEKAEEILEGE